MATIEASASSSERPSSRGRSFSRTRGRGRDRSAQPSSPDHSQTGVGVAESRQSWQSGRPPSYPVTGQQAQQLGRGRGQSFGRSTTPAASASTELPQREQPGHIKSSDGTDNGRTTQDFRRRGRGWHPSQVQQVPRQPYARGRHRYPSHVQQAPGNIPEAPGNQWQVRQANSHSDIEINDGQAILASHNTAQQRVARGRGRGGGRSPSSGVARQPNGQTANENGHSSHAAESSPASCNTSQEAGHPGRVSNSERNLGGAELPGDHWESRPPLTAPSQHRLAAVRFRLLPCLRYIPSSLFFSHK